MIKYMGLVHTNGDPTQKYRKDPITEKGKYESLNDNVYKYERFDKNMGKENLTFYLPTGLKKRFLKFCEEHRLDKTKIIEDLIRKYLLDNGLK